MKGIFGATNIAGFVSGANNCTTGKNPTYSAYASDNKLIIYRFKRGFLWGMYRVRHKKQPPKKYSISRKPSNLNS